MLDASNPPSKPVLAIHVGSVRRQAKLEVNKPFVIPNPGTQIGPVEVSLFQQLASQVLPNDNSPEVFCRIPIKRLDGVASEVQLRVRRGAAANLGKLQKTEDSVGLTRDYLDRHQLQQRIQSLIQDVLREQPANPYKYMLDQLRKSQDATKASKQEGIPATTQPAPPVEEVKPLVPRPPDQPKSGGPRGRNVPKKPERAPSVDGFGSDDDGLVPKRATGELMAAARFSIVNLLRMPMCRTAADNSLRHAARISAATSMTGLVLNSIKEKVASKVAQTVSDSPDARSLARASLKSVMHNAATLLSPQYHRALTTWTRYVAYHGASRIIDRAEGPSGRRLSNLPTPIVFLTSESSSWGSWLSAGASSAKPS